MGPKPRHTTVQSASRNGSVGSSATTPKKRSLPTPPTTFSSKRPKNAGPFFDISGSESSEDEDDQDTPEKSTPKRSVGTHRKNETIPPNRQGGKLNVSLLRSLFSQTQGSPKPYSQTRQGDAIKQHPSTSSVVLQKQVSDARVTSHQHFSKTSSIAEDASLYREDAKLGRDTARSPNTPADPRSTIYDQKRLNPVQRHTARSNADVKSEFQQLNLVQESVSLADLAHNSHYEVSNATSEETYSIKTGYDDSSSISTAIQANKNNTSVVTRHPSTGTRERLSSNSSSKPLPQFPSMVKNHNRPLPIPSSIVSGAVHPARPNVIRCHQSLDLKPSTGAPQSEVRTQGRQHQGSKELMEANFHDSNLLSSSSIRTGEHASTAPRQRVKEQGPNRVPTNQKAPSSSLVRPGQANISTQHNTIPQQGISTNKSSKPSASQPGSFRTTPNIDSAVLPKVTAPAYNQPIPATNAQVQGISCHNNGPDSDFVVPVKSELSENSESYFEYSVFQKVWGNEHDESNITATEITSQSFTNIHHANAHAQKTFNNTRKQWTDHFQYQSMETTSERDKYDCEMHTGTFMSIENPGKMSHVKLWVQRDLVSVFANQDPTAMKLTPFIMKSVFILRLFKLISAPNEASSGDTRNNLPSMRVYYPLQRTEVYTTLESANRAARNVQIELSHDTNSVSESDAKTRELKIRELDMKLAAMNNSTGEIGGYWKSQFHGINRTSDRYELVVEEAGLCGPRNL